MSWKLNSNIKCVCVCVCVSMCVSVVSDYSWPKDCSPPGFSVHGIFQARIWEWVVIFLSRGSSQPGDWTCVSCIGGQILYHSCHLGRNISIPNPLFWCPCSLNKVQWSHIPASRCCARCNVLWTQHLLGVEMVQDTHSACVCESLPPAHSQSSQRGTRLSWRVLPLESRSISMVLEEERFSEISSRVVYSNDAGSIHNHNERSEVWEFKGEPDRYHLNEHLLGAEQCFSCLNVWLQGGRPFESR